jgi:alcohol dehydrogenase (cytochrome c)
VFYGIANPAAVYWGDERRGDNLYTASVVALNAHDGTLRWHHQEVPHDVWDWDSIYEPLLIEKNGRKLVVHLNKGGFVSVLDRDKGELVNVWPIADDINWVKSIDPKTGELIGRNELVSGEEKLICPALTGARNWNHGAYNPHNGLWYNNLLDICANITIQPPTDTLQGGYNGVKKFELVKKPGKAPGRLEAFDPVTGKKKWSREFAIPHLSSLLATAGGLLFDEDPFGELAAYDADTGRTLWTFNTGSGTRGGIVSYSIKGKQYLLVPAGWGGWFGIIGGQAFPELGKINGAASLIAFTLED